MFPFGGFVSHHLQISVGNYLPNSWVMFNWDIYPLVNVHIAMEHHHILWVNQLSMAIFSIANCKRLPEGTNPCPNMEGTPSHHPFTV